MAGTSLCFSAQTSRLLKPQGWYFLSWIPGETPDTESHLEEANFAWAQNVLKVLKEANEERRYVSLSLHVHKEDASGFFACMRAES